MRPEFHKSLRAVHSASRGKCVKHTVWGGTRPVYEVTNRPTSRVEAEVLRLRALLEKGEYAAALADAETLRKQVPENRDVWYVIAVSQRYLQRIPDALATLAQNYCLRLVPGPPIGVCGLGMLLPNQPIRATLQRRW